MSTDSWEDDYEKLLQRLSNERTTFLDSIKHLDSHTHLYLLEFTDWISSVVHRVRDSYTDEINHRFFCATSRMVYDYSTLRSIVEKAIELRPLHDDDTEEMAKDSNEFLGSLSKLMSMQ